MFNNVDDCYLPIMSCCKAAEYEDRVFGRKEWDSTKKEDSFSTMQSMGTQIGIRFLSDYKEMTGNDSLKTILVLAGKGNNGGDAVLVVENLLKQIVDLKVRVLYFCENENQLSVDAKKAFDLLNSLIQKENRLEVVFLEKTPGAVFCNLNTIELKNVDCVIDGIFGYNFHSPFPKNIDIESINNIFSENIFRVAIDLPSGLEEKNECESFIADITYACGVVKKPLLNKNNLNRVGRIIPIPFLFDWRIYQKDYIDDCSCNEFVNGEILVEKFLKMKRPVSCDKRDFGHLFIIGGSKYFPGAVLMNTMAALKSGVGLVTVFCPDRFCAAFAARCPAAMWVPCSENIDGGLDSLSTLEKIKNRVSRATCILCGSGLGRSFDTFKIVESLVRDETISSIPLVFDADALQPALINLICENKVFRNPSITLLPHEGEYKRMNEGADTRNVLKAFCVLKGVITEIIDKKSFYLMAGSPVLARGGSGDLLAGITSGLIAQGALCNIEDKLALAVAWHGLAARKLAFVESERCADITHLVDYLK